MVWTCRSLCWGRLNDKAVTNQPRWFKIGTTLCDINTQQKIVDDLLGECTGLSDDTLEHRQNNSYKSILVMKMVGLANTMYP